MTCERCGRPHTRPQAARCITCTKNHGPNARRRKRDHMRRVRAAEASRRPPCHLLLTEDPAQALLLLLNRLAHWQRTGA